MSYRNNGDWDLCWYYSSSTGCKKENCTWRHEISAPRHSQNRRYEKSANRYSQNHYNKSLGMRRYNRGDSRRTPVVPFYSMKQYRNGWSDERNGSVYYPEVGNGHSPRVNSRLIRKYRYQHGTENFLSGSNPMSECSLPGIASTTSSVSSVKSRGESDPEVEEIKNGEVEEIKNAEVDTGKVKSQKIISSINLEEVLGGSKTQKKLPKEMNREKKTVSVLSPFAKVFVPSVNIMTSTNERKGTFEETKDENIPIAKMEKLASLKSGDNIIHEVIE